jgi:multiple sugar transport system permease protein
MATALPTRSAQSYQEAGPHYGLFERIGLYALLTLLALFFVLPLLWMLSTSLKPADELFTSEIRWLPQNPTISNYTEILGSRQTPVARWFANSIGVAVVTTLLTLLIDALAAYAYARMEFRGRRLLFGLLLTTLFLPGLMFLVPNFLTVARLGLLDSYVGIILPSLANVFGVFFLYQFFRTIPRELEEAAEIDGASPLTTFFRVALPLARPALATLAIITFLTSWNEFLWPLLIVPSIEMLTLPPGLATLQTARSSEYGQAMASAVIAAVPVLILYLALQRFIVKSVAMTGLKG